MPRASQPPRKRTTCRSTKFTSAKSSATFGPLSPICFSSSSKCSPRIHPIKRMVVPLPSEYLSIFRVTPVLSAIAAPSLISWIADP